MNVAPSKSVNASDLEQPTSTDVEEASTAGTHKKSLTKGKKPPKIKGKSQIHVILPLRLKTTLAPKTQEKAV